MPSTLIRLAVGLLAFGLGVSATMLWIAYRMPELQSLEAKPVLTLGYGKHRVAPMPPLDAPPPPPRRVRAPISGGILNGKAISLPQPIYPPMAKAYLVAGMVKVSIIVDESGRVMSAEAVSGHPLLQEMSVAAARQARFAPTLLEGVPVKVSGVLAYNFTFQ